MCRQRRAGSDGATLGEDDERQMLVDVLLTPLDSVPGLEIFALRA